MEVVSDLAGWRERCDDARHRELCVGLVPTMGALHAGHRSLMAAARAQCDVVVVSIFVNPLQFTDARDLENYPQTLEADLALCEAAGVDVVVTPRREEMWPVGHATLTLDGELTRMLEGRDRPGHFDGVATVVDKLFDLTGPCCAFFGEKDFQQLAVVRQLIAAHELPVTLVGCPIVRESDGLALSSRNVRLSAEGRRKALSLSVALRLAASTTFDTVGELRHALAGVMSSAGVVVHYVSVVDEESWSEVPDFAVPFGRVLIAGTVDGVRVIDNGPLGMKGRTSAARN